MRKALISQIPLPHRRISEALPLYLQTPDPFLQFGLNKTRKSVTGTRVNVLLDVLLYVLPGGILKGTFQGGSNEGTFQDYDYIRHELFKITSKVFYFTSRVARSPSQSEISILQVRT